ncbi:MAG: DUF4221 family protein [Bacteroidetes bacterium]|nr:DUF4221 family protein [Bacteroidota bacterium]
MILLFPFFAYLLFCCDSNENEIKLEKVHSFEINIGDSSKFDFFHTQYYNYNNHNCLSLYSDGKIHLFDFEHGNYCFNIDLSGFDINSFKGYYIHNTDSIFIFTKSPTNIYIVDSNSKISKSYSLDFPAFGKIITKISNPINRSGVFEYYTTNYAPLVFNDGNIFIMNFNYQIYHQYNSQTKKVEYYYDRGFEHLQGLSTCHIFDVTSDEIARVNCETGIWPDGYTKNDCYLINGPTVSRTINTTSFIYSFGMDHNIYIYDINGLHDKIFLKSKYINSLFVTDIIKCKDPLYKKRNTATSNYYKGIIYDKYKKLYYRIVVHEQNYENDNGTVNQFGDNPWSIMIIDENFEILNEIKFPPKALDFNKILITDKGLLIHKYYENNFRINHEFVLYQIIQ